MYIFLKNKHIFLGRQARRLLPKFSRATEVNYEPPGLTQLQLVLLSTSLWGHSSTLARPSKNGIGDQLLYINVQEHSFCYHTLGTHCHLGSNLSLAQKIKKLAYFNRTVR